MEMKPPGNPTITPLVTTILNNRVENPIGQSRCFALVFILPIGQRASARLAGFSFLPPTTGLKLLANLRLVPLRERAENLTDEDARRVALSVDEFLSTVSGIDGDSLLLTLAEKKFSDDHVARDTVHTFHKDCVVSRATPSDQRKQLLHHRTFGEMVTSGLLLL